MRDNSYKNIFVRYENKDQDILTTQLRMFKERYKSYVTLISVSDDDTAILDKHTEIFDSELRMADSDNLSEFILKTCKDQHLDTGETLLIAETSESKGLTDLGIEIKSPVAMAESYKKALEMLGKMIRPNAK
jgi:hypothetical protein